MLEFYDNDMSSCAQKVRLVLFEKNIPFERHHLNLRAGDQFKPEYLKLNPNAVVPTIVDDGIPVIESSIIIQYLDDAYPQPSLTFADAHGRARMRRWIRRADAGLHDACGVTSFALVFRHQLSHLDDAAKEAFFEKIPDEKRRTHVRNMTLHGLEAPGVGEALRLYHKTVREMAEQLEKTAWLAGDDYSLADVAMIPYMLRLQHLRARLVLGRSAASRRLARTRRRAAELRRDHRTPR